MPSQIYMNFFRWTQRKMFSEFNFWVLLHPFLKLSCWFWCSRWSGSSHIMLKSVNMHHFQCVCMRAQIFCSQTHCSGRCPASSSRLWRAGCPSNVAHESKLQKASVDPAVMRSGLWKNIQDQNCSGFGSEAERPETPADHSPFHWDWKLLQNKHSIDHQQLNQSSINQSINQSIIWNQTFRKQTSLAFIISSMSLIVCERAEMCLFISSSFSFIICFFCSSSSLSAVIVASSSSLRNWWSFSNWCLIWRSVCSAWDWNQTTFTSIVSINTHQHNHIIQIW